MDTFHHPAVGDYKIVFYTDLCIRQVVTSTATDSIYLIEYCSRAYFDGNDRNFGRS